MEDQDWGKPSSNSNCNWGDSVALKTGGTCEGWDSYSSGVYLQDYDNVMHWDDSGALEALQLSKERKRARELGIPCNIPAPKPDLFNEKIDWNAKPYVSPEIADAWTVIEEQRPDKGNRRGGKSNRRKFQNVASSKEVESSYLPPTGWEEPPSYFHQEYGPVWSSREDLSQEQQRYRGWENCYSQGIYSGPSSWGNNTGMKHARHWQEKAPTNGVWKPKTSTNNNSSSNNNNNNTNNKFPNHWSQGRQAKGKDGGGDWNRQYRRW